MLYDEEVNGWPCVAWWGSVWYITDEKYGFALPSAPGESFSGVQHIAVKAVLRNSAHA